MSEAVEGFGSQLRSRRRSSGLSQEELAERSGLNARTIRNLERGRARWPYRDTLHRLADALELQDAARQEFTAPIRFTSMVSLHPFGLVESRGPMGPCTPAEAIKFVAELKAQGRYQADVY